MISREEWASLYGTVPGLLMNYEPCRALHVPTSPLFSYVSGSVLNDFALQETLNRVAVGDHCVIALI